MTRRLLLAGLTAVAAALAGCGSSDGPAVTPAPITTATTPKKQAGPTPARVQRQALRYYAQRGLPVYCGGRKPYAALTFDDGPGPYTTLARKWLRRYDVDATFFLVGRNAQPFAAQARAEHREGYALGEHTWTHPYLPDVSDAGLPHEIAGTQKEIERVTGVRVQLFRPPYGAHDARVDAAVRRLGMVQVLWDVDSGDSEGADHAEIARRVLDGIGPGSIVLMHENRGQTIRALHEHILPELRRRKLKLVTVPELLARNPPSREQLEAGGRGC